MKKLIIAFATLSLFGCASSADRIAYHNAQVEAITIQMMAISKIKPLLTIEAHEGQEIRMSGVKKLEVYYPITGEAFKSVEQYRDEYLPVYLAAMNLMGIPISIATQGYFFNEALKTVNSSTHGSVYYGSNNSGLQGSPSGVQGPAGVSSVVGNSGNPAIGTSVPTTTTTTTTTNPVAK